MAMHGTSRVAAKSSGKRSACCLLHGTTVDDLILGGPAYNSKKLAQGDVIIKVDSVEATEENINDLLIGKDVS